MSNSEKLSSQKKAVKSKTRPRRSAAVRIPDPTIDLATYIERWGRPLTTKELAPLLGKKPTSQPSGSVAVAVAVLEPLDSQKSLSVPYAPVRVFKPNWDIQVRTRRTIANKME